MNTIPLKYGYNDCTYNGGIDKDGNPDFNRKLMKPFHIYYRPATHIHFVELLRNWPFEKKAWTLVFRFKYVRFWGFWSKGIFTVFHQYFIENGC